MKTLIALLAFTAAFLLLFGCTQPEKPAYTAPSNGEPSVGPGTVSPQPTPTDDSVAAESEELDQQDATLEDSIADMEELK